MPQTFVAKARKGENAKGTWHVSSSRLPAFALSRQKSYDFLHVLRVLRGSTAFECLTHGGQKGGGGHGAAGRGGTGAGGHATAGGAGVASDSGGASGREGEPRHSSSSRRGSEAPFPRRGRRRRRCSAFPRPEAVAGARCIHYEAPGSACRGRRARPVPARRLAPGGNSPAPSRPEGKSCRRPASQRSGTAPPSRNAAPQRPVRTCRPCRALPQLATDEFLAPHPLSLAPASVQFTSPKQTSVNTRPLPGSRWKRVSRTVPT